MEADLQRFLTYLDIERGASPLTLRNYGAEVAEFIAFAQARGVERWQDVDVLLVRSWLAGLHRAELSSCFRGPAAIRATILLSLLEARGSRRNKSCDLGADA